MSVTASPKYTGVEARGKAEQVEHSYPAAPVDKRSPER